MLNTNQEDIVRVLRIIEYVGPRKLVEDQVARSIHGERRFARSFEGTDTDSGNSRAVVIRAATIGTYPEILDAAMVLQKLTNTDGRIA